MYTVHQDKRAFEKITVMKDSKDKFQKLCDYMLFVAPHSYYWNKAKEESMRLQKLGYGF